MRRSVDLECVLCGAERHDIICAEDEQVTCHSCNSLMRQIWWQRQRRAAPAQWDDQTAVVVHVARDPSIPDDVSVRYPCRVDAPVPAGYEAVRLRSLREVDRFERAHNVQNHRMHWDNNGRGPDDSYRGDRMTH